MTAGSASSIGASLPPTSADVAIVGGGVIGCSIAYYLAKAGISVIVVEEREVGAAASSAAAGMLTPIAEDPGGSPLRDLTIKSLGMFPGLAAALFAESGIDIELTPSPVLMLPIDAGAVAGLKALTSLKGEFEVEWIERHGLQSVEPMLAATFDGGLRSLGQAHVNPRRLVKAFRTAATCHGAQFFEFTRADELLLDRRRVTGVRCGERRISAGAVVLAGGAWSGAFAAQVGTALPIKPIRGQIVSLLPRGSSLRHVCFLGHRYLCPQPDGTVLVGSTQDEVGFNNSTTAEGVAGLLQLATSVAPALAEAELVDCWAGLRPGTPDGLPILGPIQGLDGVIVASGHFRRGILLAPITGITVAQIIKEPAAAAAVSWLSPERFRDI